LITDVFGQKRKQKEYTYSSTTDYYNASKYEHQRQTTFVALYSKKPTKVLLGNECVSSFTRELGFEYVYPFTSPGAPQNDLHIFFSNTVHQIGLTFKNGLGWKRKVRKRIEQCRTSSGDFTG
jgi:hypothetical protein